MSTAVCPRRSAAGASAPAMTCSRPLATRDGQPDTVRRSKPSQRDANNALATDEQKPARGFRDVPAVLQRPDPLAAQVGCSGVDETDAGRREAEWLGPS